MSSNAPLRPNLLARLVLVRPARVHATLERVRASGLCEAVPELWQICLGVFRMWHRMLYRPESVGLSVGNAVRPGWRARMLQNRILRFPFLLREGSVVPLDLSGLASDAQVLMCHLLGTHHDGRQFVYDLEILSVSEGALQELKQRTEETVATDDSRTRLLRDLVVYEGYHEELLAAVTGYIEGDRGLSPEEAADPDISFFAYLRWCAAQPKTLRETWTAYRRGDYDFGSGLKASPTSSGQSA